MKRYLTFAAMILLAAVIFRYEEKPKVEPVASRIPPAALTLARIDVPKPATNSHFLDNINLSYDPVEKISGPDPQPASLAVEKDLPPARLGKIQPKPDETTAPVLTVVDRKLNYELLGSKDFSLKFNLTPAYPNPEALIPNRLDPGVGVSIKF